MEQEPLFHEDIYAAISHVVAAMGGNKRVGAMLWPSLTADAAGRKLANCLNPDRAENLKPEELMMVFREANAKSAHSGMAYFNSECGYSAPEPLKPEDEKAKLQRQYIEATKALGSIAKQMERYSDLSVRAVS